MRDRLEGIAVFVETVEAGSFARAGARLALSRSAVGKAIARLEARLGVRLFHRTTRAQALTEEGHAFHDRCRRALDELRAGEQAMEAGRTDIAGRLRVSMPSLFGRHRVAPILLDLARRHPRLELDLRFSDLVVDVIGEGYDLAIRSGPLTPASGLRARKLFDHRKIMCAAPGYLAARGVPTTIDDLASHESLVYWRHGRVLPWDLRDPAGRSHDARPDWRLRFDDLEAIVDAAVAGLGIAFLPDWLALDYIEDGRLVALLRDHASPPADTFAVWPEANQLPRRTRLTIDTLVAALAGANRRPSGNEAAPPELRV